MKSKLTCEQAKIELFKKYGYDIVEARKYILACAKLKKGEVLEVGTGKGHMTAVLAQKGYKVVSIDVDRKAQRHARESLKTSSSARSAVFKIMDAEKLRFPENSFDSVVSVNFIHHAKDPVACVKEMARVAGKKLVIADLNKRGMGIMRKAHRLDGHTHQESRISLVSVRTLLKRLGMSVVTYHDRCQIVLVAQKGGIR